MAYNRVLTAYDQTVANLGTVAATKVLGRRMSQGRGAIYALSSAETKEVIGVSSVPNENIHAFTGAGGTITKVGDVTTGTWQGSPIAFLKGGLGSLGSSTEQLGVGDLIVSTSSAWGKKSPDSDITKFFKSGAAAANVGFGAIDVSTAEVSGTLAPIYGGTGLTVAGANNSLLRYNSTTVMTAETQANVVTALSASPTVHNTAHDGTYVRLNAANTLTGKLEFGTISADTDTIGTSGTILKNFGLLSQASAPTASTTAGGDLYVKTGTTNELWVNLLTWTA